MIVSPTGAESSVLIDAIIKPTIPDFKQDVFFISGLNVPSLSTINSLLLESILILSFRFISPSITFIRTTMPK